MKNIWYWFNDRTGLGDACGRLANLPVPGRAGFCKVWPCAITFAFCIEAITGFFLWVYYSPSAQTAWESVYYLQNHVTGGWLLRAIHHYTAHVLLAMFLLYIVQQILTGVCRAPRELVFWANVGLALFALAAILTGDLLYWDQNGYAATSTRTGFLPLLPWIGDSLQQLANGGPAIGSLALTRFFALHVGLFSGGFLLLLVIRSVLAHRANATLAASRGVATPYWPAQAWRAGVACLIVLAVVLGLSFQHGVKPPAAGVPLLSPADVDPAHIYSAARPEWFLVGVFQFSQQFRHWEIIPIFVVTGILLCIVLAMPFLGRRPLGQAFNIVFTLVVVAALVGLTYASYRRDREDPTFQRAVAVERWQAARVAQLAEHQGIPPTGALTLLKADPKTQGPWLFAEQCTSCHVHDQTYEGPEFKTDKPTAPELTGYASRQWLAGLLNPKQINGPKYFRNTKFRGKRMADWVKQNLSELEGEDKGNLTKVIAAVSAEAKLPAQREIDARDAKMIEEGRKLLLSGESTFTCTDCHAFRGKGRAGDAPVLTGYGSAAWISGIISNPADHQFYGKNNDRMPVYAPSAKPAENTLSPRQIDLLTDWLRGDWYEQKPK